LPCCAKLAWLSLDLGPAVWRVLDKCHNIRNLGEYEGDLNIDERIVIDLVAACQAVAVRVNTFIAFATNAAK
jgi:hypothetical protein